MRVFWSQTLLDPEITVTSTTTATVSAEVTQQPYAAWPEMNGERVVLADLVFEEGDLDDGTVSDAEARFTEDGAAVYGNYGDYVPGTVISPLTFSFETEDSEEPEPATPSFTTDVTEVPDERIDIAITGEGYGDVQALPGQTEPHAYFTLIEKDSDLSGVGEADTAISAEIDENGNISDTLSVPAEELDETKSYEVISWPSRSFPTEENLYARADVTIDWAALFPEDEDPVADPQIIVAPSDDLDPAVENELAIEGTGYVGDGAANGAYVVFGEKSVWSGEAPLPSDGWIDLGWVMPAQIQDGAFSTTLTVPAGTLDPEKEYHVATSAAHQLSVTDRSLDAFHDVTVAQPAPEPAVDTTTTIEASAETIDEGDEVTLTAAVDPAEATGTVTFSTDGGSLAEPVEVENGAAELTTAELPAGENSITAGFTPADADEFNASTSEPITVTVNAQAVADPKITVTPSEDLDPTVENEITVEGTGYVGEGAANGAYVLVGEKSVWSGEGPLPSDGWIDLAWVPAGDITDGAFSTTLTIPADELDPETEYHVATSAAHQLSATDRSLDAFHDITVKQDASEEPEEPTVKINGEDSGTAQVTQGDEIEFTAGPFEAGTEFTVEVRSDPVDLGAVEADADGVAAASWTVPEDFEVGDHEVAFIDDAGQELTGAFEVLAAGGGDGDGDDQAGNGGQGDQASNGGQGGLANTGANGLESSLLFAGAVILLGAAGLMLARRRTAAHCE